MNPDTSTYETYEQTCVYHTGKTASVCLLCPCPISAKGGLSVLRVNLQSHFAKNHERKDGFKYCFTCFKSICTVGQVQQEEIHLSSSKHVLQERRKGHSFKFCMDCGTVEPPMSHNPKHQVKTMEFLTGADEIATVDDKCTEAQVASILMSVMYKRKCGSIVVGSWCNEHFEKTFRCDAKHSPIPVSVIKQDVACKTCQRCLAVWPTYDVKTGVLYSVQEADLRKYAVGMIKKEVDEDLQDYISPAEYGELDEELQDLYEFNRNVKAFELVGSRVRAMSTQKFMESGASTVAQAGSDHVDAPVADSDDEISDDDLNA